MYANAGRDIRIMVNGQPVKKAVRAETLGMIIDHFIFTDLNIIAT